MARSARTTSLARSIVWSYWWHRLLAFVLVDVLIFGALVGCFALRGAAWAAEQGLPTGSLVVRKARRPLDRITYEVPQRNGEHLTFRLSAYTREVWPLLAIVVAGEVVSLVALPFSTRRVRRKLQPLNDLALVAEELGNATSRGMEGPGDLDQDQLSNLEQAIHSASVDQPFVSTGDKDLQSIEVALNGLLKQMQEAKLQQMRFVSDASHELRTPIAVIQGYVQMLDRWGKTDEEVLDESIAALKAESEHMQELVEQLLFLARGDSGRNTLQRERFNLAEAMQEVWEESRMIDDAHVYTYDVPGSDASDSAFELTGDPGMIKQVARILVQNAAAYAPEGTQIALSVRADDAGVVLRVQDEGIGISEEDAAHIFERFYRADEARDRREGGTGLGLSIAKWIVDAHGGSIDVLSREGVGTRFTVRFPR
ncbi:MAG: sensor histidine kinase [Atopobiaceae bacterium]|nr:sensor histidine kinase [Atopobiaceae bacterium]